MRYCPKCAELSDADNPPICPSCGGVLQALDSLPEEEGDRLVVLKWCESIGEAEVLKAALEAQGIDALIEDENLLAAASGWDGRGGATDTRVTVHLRDAETALEFLRRKDAGELTLPDEDVPGEEPLPDIPIVEDDADQPKA